MSGDLKLNRVQLGDNPTPANNIVVEGAGDGTLKISRGSIGNTTSDILNISATGTETIQKFMQIGPTVLSGANIDFTGIPSWAKEITLVYMAVSTSGTSPLLVQVGTLGGMENTGYNSLAAAQVSTTANIASAAGIIIYNDTAADVRSGSMSIYPQSGNVISANYTMAGTIGRNITFWGASSKVLNGVLDRIRITTVNGTDAYDNGQITLLIKG